MPGKIINLLFASVFLFAQHLKAQEESFVNNPDTAVAAAPVLSAAARIISTDTLAKSKPQKAPFISFKSNIQPKPLSFRSVAIPVAMIGYGALTLSSNELKKLNLSLRKEVWEKSGHTPVEFDDYSKYIPAIAVYGLNLAGIKGKNNFVDRTMLYGMSNLIGGGIVASTKRLTDVIRPDSSNRLSFPSGHTAQAFIAAEFMRQEYKDLSPWYGIAGYAVAAGTGFLRMYNNKHWLNDVVAGAGIGILSTRISYWLYPKIKNALFKDRNTSTVIMPTYQNKAFGVGMVHSF